MAPSDLRLRAFANHQQIYRQISTNPNMASKGAADVAARLVRTAVGQQTSLLQSAMPYSTAGGVSLYKLPELPYAYSALGEYTIGMHVLQPSHALPLVHHTKRMHPPHATRPDRVSLLSSTFLPVCIQSL